MATMVGQAQNLLDFTKGTDVRLLDEVVDCMYSGTGENQRVAQKVLSSLREHPDAWTRVDTIIQSSSRQQTKYYALQILEQVIKTRWKILPRQECEGIKKYVVEQIVKASADTELRDQEKIYANKLNVILVQILKREWPRNWESFIPDIVSASKTNENLCQNNMVILKLLSEEVFDFSKGQMTQTKIKHLKSSMRSAFSEIFQLCRFVLTNSQNVLLVEETLETLLRFLNWIPLTYVFETNLISVLTYKFLSVPAFMNVTMQCFTEIVSVRDEKYDEELITLFTQTMNQLQVILPMNLNIREAYSCGQEQEKTFIHSLAMFLSTFLEKRVALLEKKNPHDVLLNALHYLILISAVEELELFKICLEFWKSLVADLYTEPPIVGNETCPYPRRQFYSEMLSKLRCVVIDCMVKPNEVIVVVNENGEVVRELMKDTDSVNLYMSMRETLVYLTHLDHGDMERILTEKLMSLVGGGDWSWKNLNTLSWAIGSISGAMNKKVENIFIFRVIDSLLSLYEQKEGKEDKSVIASNIMYVVGQYPRFFKSHWGFLKTVLAKLFEFMYGINDGVQDMACDTFLKISLKCQRCFLTIQEGEEMPFIDTLLSNMDTVVATLKTHQIHTVYEAIGHIVRRKECLIEKYMTLPNQIWDDAMKQASKDNNYLREEEVLKRLASIIKINACACKGLDNFYLVQIHRIYLDMLNVYKYMSVSINTIVTLNGKVESHQVLIQNIKAVKKEIIKLMSDWISRSKDHKTLVENFLPPWFDVVLPDYQLASTSLARESEVLNCMSAIVKTLKRRVSNDVPKIFNAVFRCTVEMINKDFHEHIEFRINFYNFLGSVIKYSFPTLLDLPPDDFKLMVDSIIWAFQHTMKNIAEIGLRTLKLLLQNTEERSDEMQAFYQTYFTTILENIFSVMTDASHTSCFYLHASILANMFSIVEKGRIVLLFRPDTDNTTYVKDFVARLLRGTFPHLNDNQIKITVQGMFNLNQNLSNFKVHLRDFLVQTREYAGETDLNLFLEEREAALIKAEEERRLVQLTLPGILLNPYDVHDEMHD